MQSEPRLLSPKAMMTVLKEPRAAGHEDAVDDHVKHESRGEDAVTRLEDERTVSLGAIVTVDY